MGIYLGDKKIQSQLVAPIKGTKQDKQSWTDGTQTSVTPAGFTDSGFRFYKHDNAQFNSHSISDLDSDNTTLYNALLSSSIYLNGSGTSTNTVQEWITNNSFNGQYLVTKVLIPKEDTADLNFFYYIKYVMTSASSTAMKSIIMQLAFVDYDSNGNVDWVRPIFTEHIDSTSLVDFSNRAVSSFAYYTPGLTAVMAIGLATDESVYSECSFNIRVYNMPIYTQTSDTVTAAKTDYNAISTELTARGNTITSLNTQGQNLVTKHNTLVDKYNNIISQWGANKED